MARDGTKTGGRNFKKGKSGNPGGMTKEQAEVRHLTRETLKDLLNTLKNATHEQMMTILENPTTSALTMMVVKTYMTIIETGDMKSFNLLLDRLVGKVKDEIDVNMIPTLTVKKRDGSTVVMGAKKVETNE